MRRVAQAVGILAILAALAFLVDVFIYSVRIQRVHIVLGGTRCEEWCPCKCNQQSCGCHTPAALWPIFDKGAHGL